MAGVGLWKGVAFDFHPGISICVLVAEVISFLGVIAFYVVGNLPLGAKYLQVFRILGLGSKLCAAAVFTSIGATWCWV